MPDPRRIQILVEGPDDRAVLAGLEKLGLLPERVEVAQPAKAEGNSAVVAAAAARALVGKSSILMVDLDHHPTPAAVAEWVAGGLRSRGFTIDVTAADRVPLLHLHAGEHETRAAVVAVGLATDPVLRGTYALEQFAIDDFLLRLSREPRIFDAISDLQERLSHTTALKKVDRTIEVLRDDDGGSVRITKAKRILFLLRAIADFRAASATFAGRVIEVAAREVEASTLRRFFEPLLGDLEAAAALLR